MQKYTCKKLRGPITVASKSRLGKSFKEKQVVNNQKSCVKTNDADEKIIIRKQKIWHNGQDKLLEKAQKNMTQSIPSVDQETTFVISILLQSKIAPRLKAAKKTKK